jgi:hypothetical protein
MNAIAKIAPERWKALSFLKANLATARAIGGTSQVTFSFTGSPFDPLAVPAHDSQVSLPYSVNVSASALWDHLRMRVDTGAAWIRDKDVPGYKDNTPQDASEFLLYRTLEKARREIRLIQDFQGAAANIVSRVNLKDRRHRSDHLVSFQRLVDNFENKIPSHQSELVAEGLYCAALFTFLPSDLKAALPYKIRFLGDVWAERLRAVPNSAFLSLGDHIHEPDVFCKKAAALVKIFLKDKSQSLRPVKKSTVRRLGLPPQSTLPWRKELLPSFHSHVVAWNLNRPVQIQSHVISQPKSPKNKISPKRIKAQQNLQRSTAAITAKFTESIPAYAVTDASISQSSEAPKDLNQWIKLAELYNELELREGEPVRRGGRSKMSDSLQLDARRGGFLQAYRELRHECEEVITVPALYKGEEDTLRRQWKDMQKDNKHQVASSRKLTRRLERWLQAQTGEKPLQDCDAGLLDLTRLASVVTNPTGDGRYIGTTVASQLDAVVSLLFDFSGSMRGSPITAACLLSYELSYALERCKVPSEVLGFTTENGKSRHIIVKDFKAHTSKVAHHFGMANVGSMGGTNDADAILWSASRLLARPEKRKILVVVSDVQPNASFIQKRFPDLRFHALLKSVIMHLEERRDIDIIGVGVGYQPPVHTYYPNGFIIREMKELGAALIPRLQQVLDPAYSRRSARQIVAPLSSDLLRLDR